MPYHKTKILLVDDERSLLMTTGQMLRLAGYDVLTAENGIKALEIARSEPVRLVLLDIMMPDRSGFEVLRDLHDDAKASKIPVVMLTALRSSADKETALQAGAKDVMVKPVDRKELVNIVRLYAGPAIEAD